MRSNIKTLAALLMAGAAMTACSNNDENILEEVSQPDQPKVYTMTVEATKGDNGTRGLDLDNDYLKVKWDEGETVIVMKWDDTEWKKIGELTAVASETASTTLNGTLTEAPEASNTKLFLHGTSVSYDNQQGTLEYIAKNCDFAAAMIEHIETDETTNTIKVSGIEFISQQAIVQFHLKDKEDHDLNVTKLKIEDSEGNMYNELNAFTGNLQDLGHVNGSVKIDYIAGTGTMFVALANVVPSSKLKLTATVPSGGEGQDAYTYTYEKTNVALEAGKYYDITVKMEKYVPDVPVIDLSMVDCAGNERTNAWTANCYMVHTAGNYKLPLVYGNAIKNGETNAAAYTGITAASTGKPTTLTFPRHDGEAIADPWIKNNGITVTTAELLWQDAQGLVTAVDIDGDYLTLTVGKNATAQEGNALIAAKAADGTIVWSWHIWVTKQTFATLTTITVSDYGYKVTPVNLGWVGDATSGATGYCTFYQWGRKDAFIPSTGIGDDDGNSDNHTVYDINNNDVTTTAFSHTNDINVTIGGNIQHPTVHNLNNSTTFGPCKTQYYNMWDAQQTSNAENTAAATVKTVYDPCPPGFCVPTSGLYNYIKSQPVPDFSNGYTYSGVFFPASGYRSYNSGLLSNVGTGGYCWSATPKNITHGHYFKFDSGSWALSSNARAMGCPVRAVAEE